MEAAGFPGLRHDRIRWLAVAYLLEGFAGALSASRGQFASSKGHFEGIPRLRRSSTVGMKLREACRLPFRAGLNISALTRGKAGALCLAVYFMGRLLS
jgi:hypothetical protein